MKHRNEPTYEPTYENDHPPNRFKEAEAQAYITRYSDIPEALALRVYTSQLIGRDSRLVLHGGGNTSVKLRIDNILGEQIDVMFVKGSGWDLATIEPEGFAGLDLSPLRKLARLESLSDDEMDNQLKIHRISGRSPHPSVEALLHAFLPHRYVDHTHADNILILTNQKDGTHEVKRALGENVAVLPYAMSGFPLAKSVLGRYDRRPDTDAVVVINHGIFTFGDDARSSYEKMLHYVGRAAAYVEEKTGTKPITTRRKDARLPRDLGKSAARCAQVIRGSCAHRDSGGRLQRFYVEIRQTPDMKEASVSTQARDVCRSGVLTPDHTIRTKNTMAYLESIPEDDEILKQRVGRVVDDYTKAYHQYFQEQIKGKKLRLEPLDPFPRLFLVGGLGLVALGSTRKAARIAADIGQHTVSAKLRALAMGGYLPIPDSHVFDMEYWGPQQKKLGGPAEPPLQGQVAVITGGGGAIGFGVARQVLAAGAIVVIADIDKTRLKKVRSILANTFGEDRVDMELFDVTVLPSVETAFERISSRIGGIDLLVPNAGIAHVAKIEDMDPGVFDRVLAVNLKGTLNVIKASVPVFKRQGTGGNIVVISSKNVFDPGASFGAYSASKAGAHQLSKIAALELAGDGVRVNMVNPDAVFGDETVSSQLWDLVGPERMKSRGLDADGLKDYYRERSLLKLRVLPEHVGNAVVFFASEQTPTTGAALPVDGGIPSAFPR
jgi:rhamnose utilization protein RhaD (predicted bifunctional aldolase and dehydrogenase)/NAD(P)-dependent dehydrogenase (short-subunit alcohol dehydrogenase family)